MNGWMNGDGGVIRVVQRRPEEDLFFEEEVDLRPFFACFLIEACLDGDDDFLVLVMEEE